MNKNISGGHIILNRVKKENVVSYNYL